MVAIARTHNKSNEITGLTGGGWAVPSYDAAGNTTSAPAPRDPATAASDQAYTLAEYTYDARSFRVQKKEYAPGTSTHASTPLQTLIPALEP